MKMQLVSMIGVAALVVTVGSCGDDDDGNNQLPNPAAVFCEENGGTVSGPEPMCELPDGSVVDAWEYYRAQDLTDEPE